MSLKESFKENPGAWVLAFLLAISVYGNYETHSHFRKVCEAIGDAMMEPPLNASRFQIQGWQRQELDEIDDLCGSETADPEPSDPQP